MFSIGVVACPPYNSHTPFLRCKILILPPTASTPPRAWCEVILQRKFVTDANWNLTDRPRGPVTGWGMDGVIGVDHNFIDQVVCMSDFSSKRRMTEREALEHRWFANVKGRERGVIKITA